jgi:hypothetical protein
MAQESLVIAANNFSSTNPRARIDAEDLGAEIRRERARVERHALVTGQLTLLKDPDIAPTQMAEGS